MSSFFGLRCVGLSLKLFQEDGVVVFVLRYPAAIACGKLEVHLHALLTSAVARVDCSLLRFGHFTRLSLSRRMGRWAHRFRVEENLLFPPGIEQLFPRTSSL
jgi:hypothetical protein